MMYLYIYYIYGLLSSDVFTQLYLLISYIYSKLREPLIPEWVSWNSLTRFVDRTIRDPVVNTSSKLYASLAPETSPPGLEKRRPDDYDEEGGSGSGSNDDFDDDDDDVRPSEGVLDLQPLSVNQANRKSMKKKHLKGHGISTSTTSSGVYANISHYLSLSTLTTLFTTQQREWLQNMYESTSIAVWNYVTNSAEFLVDGQPVRRGVNERERSQPLPP